LPAGLLDFVFNNNNAPRPARAFHMRATAQQKAAGGVQQDSVYGLADDSLRPGSKYFMPGRGKPV
jgi:hypothetical protein